MKKIISASIILVIPILAFAQSNVSSSDTTTKKQSAPVSAVEAASAKGAVIQGNVQPKSAAEQIRSGMQPGATSTNPGTTAKQPASAVELYEQTHQNNGTTPH